MKTATRLINDLPHRGYEHSYVTKGTETVHTLSKGLRTITIKVDVTRKDWAEINDTASE